MDGRGRTTRRTVLRGGLGIAVGGALGFRRQRDGRAAQADAGPVWGGTPTVAMAGVPSTLDPARSTQLTTWWLAGQLYDTPLREAPNEGILPGLAVAVTAADDGLTWTLALRSDVAFHDGQPLTTRDVVASVERAALSGPNAWRLEQVRAVEARDERHVDIRLSRPNTALPAALASPMLAILPQATIATGDPFAGARPPVGSGPFSFAAWREGGELALTRNSAYWRLGLPYLDGVEFRYLPEDTARTTAMVTGEVDAIQTAPLLDVPTLADDTNVTLVGGVSRRVCGLTLNLTRGPLSDVRLRQIVAVAIDREALVSAAAAGEATAQTTLFPDEHWAGLEPPVTAAETGATLATLTELGYPAGLRLTLVCPEQDPSLANAAVLLQGQLAQVGIAVRFELLDAQRLAESIAARAFDLLIGYRGPWLDPHELVRPLLASDGVDNVGGYTNPDVDRLIASAIETVDLQVRADAYRAIQELVLADVPWITLFLPNHYHATTTRLRNVRAYPTGSLQGLARAWLVPASEGDSGIA